MTTRKLFLNQLACGSFVLALHGCGGGGDSAAPAPSPTPAPSPPPPPPAAACNAFTFSANHGHSLTIARADLDSTTSKTYSIAGTAGHDHRITLTTGQLQQLKAGMTVSVTSTFDGHSHQMGGGCA